MNYPTKDRSIDNLTDNVNTALNYIEELEKYIEDLHKEYEAEKSELKDKIDALEGEIYDLNEGLEELRKNE